MKSIAIAVGLVLVLSVPGSAADEKALNGTWTAVAATQNGEKVDDGLVKSAKLVFADGKYSASLGDIEEEGTFQVDRSKKPNTIDMRTAGTTKKKPPPRPGVFELSGDTLTICFNLETNQRPRDLTSTAENKNFVVVYRRGK